MHVLCGFKSERPLYQTSQIETLEWLLAAYLKAREVRYGVSAESAHASERLRKLLQRYGCSSPKIESRGHETRDSSHRDWAEMEISRLVENPHGITLSGRMEVFARSALRAFKALYEGVSSPPKEIVHVTCTGYVSPNAAQIFCESRGWQRTTRIANVYHSGCYAAVPAVRQALQTVETAGAASARADVVHTELCSLHFDPMHQEPEQLVVHSLFADGFIKYSVQKWDRVAPALRVLSIAEELVPNTPHEMTWGLGPYGFKMSLSRAVPDLLSQVVEPFFERLAQQAGLSYSDLAASPFAIHPGGPRIIEVLQDKLRLSDAQVSTSREILRTHGNMSSATLPTVWEAMLLDPNVPSGTLIPSIAFGPGLTLAGILLQKVCP